MCFLETFGGDLSRLPLRFVPVNVHELMEFCMQSVAPVLGQCMKKYGPANDHPLKSYTIRAHFTSFYTFLYIFLGI